MSNGNSAEQPAASNPPAPSFDPMRAEHEAAHAVVIDDLGYQVTWVNIRAGSHDGQQLNQMTKADWGAFGETIRTINWDNAAQRDAIRPDILRYVTMLVAGHLAENLINETIKRVSTRIQEDLWLLKSPPNRERAIADRDRTALYLFLVQCNTMEHVVAAEQRALEILTQRQLHLKALAALLVEHGTVEGAMLNNALGKGIG